MSSIWIGTVNIFLFLYKSIVFIWKSMMLLPFVIFYIFAFTSVIIHVCSIMLISLIISRLLQINFWFVSYLALFALIKTETYHYFRFYLFSVDLCIFHLQKKKKKNRGKGSCDFPSYLVLSFIFTLKILFLILYCNFV